MSRMYQSKDARDHAIKRLQSRRWSIPPCTLISVSLQYNIKDIFKYAFGILVPLRLHELDHRLLTPPVWNTVIVVKERIDHLRRIVACESPVMQHSKHCRDRKACNDDWKQVWWNGMGRYLLDGRNPLPYNEALEQFQELDYGHVHPDCWRIMLDFIKTEKAFRHEGILIEGTAQELADHLISEPNFDDDNATNTVV